MRTQSSTLKRARKLRQQMTDAELKMWSLLRRGQIDGYRFRKQVPIGPYVVDFACLKKRLIIEIDGGQHSTQKAQDDERTRVLEQLGYRVLRFWNNDILTNPDGVLTRLHHAFYEMSDDHAEAHRH